MKMVIDENKNKENFQGDEALSRQKD